MSKLERLFWLFMKAMCVPVIYFAIICLDYREKNLKNWIKTLIDSIIVILIISIILFLTYAPHEPLILK